MHQFQFSLHTLSRQVMQKVNYPLYIEQRRQNYTQNFKKKKKFDISSFLSKNFFQLDHIAWIFELKPVVQPCNIYTSINFYCTYTIRWIWWQWILHDIVVFIKIDFGQQWSFAVFYWSPISLIKSFN